MSDSSSIPASGAPQRFHKRWLMFKLWLLRNFLPTETAMVLVGAGVVGMAGALAAILFRWTNEWLQSVFFQSNSGGLLSAATQALGVAPDRPWIGILWVGLLPAVGGLLAGFVLLFGEKITRGRKAVDLLEAVAVRDGVMRFRPALVKSLSSLLSISSGGSLGREGAFAQLGATLASKLGQWRRASPQRLRLLVGCGVASGIAAAYNAPIAAALFVSEIILGNFAMDVFGPVVFSSVMSTVVTHLVLGEAPLFGVMTFEMKSPWELIPYLLLGLLCGLAAPAFRLGLKAFKEMFDRVTWPIPIKMAVGGLMVGAVAVHVPGVMGNGYEAASKVLTAQWVGVWLLLSLLVLKAAATSATVGSGAVGGIFTPTLFVGAALGSLFGAAVVRWAPFLSAGQQSYALVGMGGLLAGTTHAPLMAIMMIFEMSLEYSVVLPLMLCCVLASFMSRRIWSESIYTEPLQRTDTSWRVAPEALVMTSIRVSEVMHGEVVSVRNTAPFAEVVDKFFRSRRNNLYVVDGQNKFLGAIALHDLKELLHRREELSFLIAHDLLNPDFPVATPDERLAQVFEKFLVQECERLPVVDNVKARTLIGSISKRDIIGVYGQEILHKDLLLTRFARRTSRGVESHYVELPAPYEIEEITVSEALNGKQIREIDLSRRFGLLALIIKRTDDLGEESSRVADGAHRVQKGDRLLVLGTPENIERFEKLAVPMGARGSGAAEKRP